MAQPSQQFPPWLSPSAVVVTDMAGAVSTETSIVYIPPTYFGPSIPLGSLYIFGGSTEPPRIVLPSPAPSSATSVPPPVTTATTLATPSSTSISVIPTTIISSISTSAIPTSASSVSLSSSVSVSLSASSSTASISLTSSPTPSSTSPPPLQATGLTKGQLVGVIVASILGLIFLFVLLLALYLAFKSRRNRNQIGTLTIPPDDDDDFYVIPTGEGSPRHSGEEDDPFLRRSSAVLDPTSSPRPGGSRFPAPTSGSDSSRGSTNSHASGFGELLDRPGLGYLPAMPEQHEGDTTLDVEQDNVFLANLEGEEDYSGGYAYSTLPQIPPLPRMSPPLPPTSSPLAKRFPFITSPSKLSNESSYHGDLEEAHVQTATRLKVAELLEKPPTAEPTHQRSTGLLGSLRLGGLASMSWFRNLDSSSRHSVASPSFMADPFSEKDLETGRALLSPTAQNSARPRGAAAEAGPVPSVSSRSGTSGHSLYHDATSSLPGTPLPTPLPRALTPPEPFATDMFIPNPPAYNSPTSFDNDVLETSSSSGSLVPSLFTRRSLPRMAPALPTTTTYPSPPQSPAGTTSFDTTQDVLDMPAPTALNHFSSLSSFRESASGSGSGSSSSVIGGGGHNIPSFPPPGLDTVRPVGWSDSATAVNASRASLVLQPSAGLFDDGGVSPPVVDALEEAPPDAEHGWRTISYGDGRGPFGRFVHSPGVMSERGSLHSYAPSSRSTGSAPAASPRRDMDFFGSIGSNSSSSGRSVFGSAVSAVRSLPRMGSLREDQRRRGNVSPALSAFGQQVRAAASSPSSAQGQSQAQADVQCQIASVALHSSPSPITIGSPPSAHLSSGKKSSTPGPARSFVSDTTAVNGDTSFGSLKGMGGPARSSSPMSTSMSMSMMDSAPWVAGLDGDWQAAA